MSSKGVPAPSIEEDLEDTSSKQEYMNNLKVKCRMQQEAFMVAESLITTYQKENQSLREQIIVLKQQLNKKEQKLMQFKEEEAIIKTLQKNILKYSERVNQLLEQNLIYEQKVRSLERQLQKEKVDHQRQIEGLRQKMSKHRKQQSQRKQLESHFHNYLKLAQPEDSFEGSPKNNRNSVGKQSFVTAVTKDCRERAQSNIKVMQWKLKQKDEEIIILLKRVKQMEDRVKIIENQSKKQRVMTSDSIQNFYSNKKSNISEFIQ